MDAETRHELKHNELADLLFRLREWNNPRVYTWLLAIVAVILAYVSYRLWGHRAQVANQRNWTVLAEVNPANAALGGAPLDQLRSLIAGSSDPSLLAAARVRLATALTKRGMLGDQAALTGAGDELRQVIDAPGTPGNFKAAALYRLGMLQETRGELEAAGQTWKRLSEGGFEGSPFKELAAERIGSLDRMKSKVVFEPGLPPLPPEVSGETPPQSAPATAPSSAPSAASQP